MNDYSAEYRTTQRRLERDKFQRRQREIGHYLVYTMIPKAARTLERRNFPLENSTNENLIVNGKRRTGWRLVTRVKWNGNDWDFYILQHGTLVMHCTDESRHSKVIPRHSLQRYITSVEDLQQIYRQLRSLRGLGNALEAQPFKLDWWERIGFWFNTF